MKYVDKFLKKLNTDRNTFASYVLILITIYLCVDRITEMLLMIITGVSFSYWGPIKYTLALACPMFAYAFSIPSKFVHNKPEQVTVFFVFATALYIIAISMFTQWLNMGAWLLLLSVPNYTEIITDFSDLVTPAFMSISLYLPLVTFYPLFKGLYFSVYDSKDKTRSIWDYRGIDLSDKSKGHGPYTCEVYVCTDNETGKKIVMPETSRYQALLVCGGSGSGKTSLVFEPLIAKDIERKSFFKQVSKELGYTALRTQIAVLNKPYDNDYLNKNFNLNMISPVEGKESLFKAYLKKMTLSSYGDETIYRDLGLTLMSSDYDVISHMTDVCKNFGIDYDIIDPIKNSTIGLNPFIYDDTSKIAITISSVLKGMYSIINHDVGEAYRSDLTMQAIENSVILLKEIYPKMHEGTLPNLEDLLQMLTNFELIEKMCEIMAHDEELKEQYRTQITYFKKNFYKDAPGKEDMEKYIFPAVSQLDNLLRLPGIKRILCNRHSNIDFDKLLSEGKMTFICTRRGDLGVAGHKAFGLFFLISLENAVLRRPGNENTRIPHFLFVDEFADFVSKATEPMFTMFRKYKVATSISIQSLAQLDLSERKSRNRDIILSNCVNKIFTGNAEYDEIEWWANEFGSKREWTYTNNIDMEKLEYDSKYGNVKWAWVPNFKAGKLQNLPQKRCAYKIRSEKGSPMVGPGDFDYLASKYKEKQNIKTYDFGKFSDSVTTATEDDDSNLRKKFDLKNLDFTDERNEFNPVQTDTTDSKYLFDNEDAIVVNLKKGKN